MSKTWISDDRGNRCSVEYFGSEEAAKAALASLKDCSGCSDCSRCSYCSDCSYCSYCSYCSDCSYCSGCSDCSDCSDCSGCSPTKAGETAAAVPAIPVIPDIHKRIYERVSQPGALNMGDWHTCDTTHCRAGWVVHEAGEAGYALEKFHNTALAAQLIYRASGFEINPSRFYDPADLALADMKKLAEAGE